MIYSSLCGLSDRKSSITVRCHYRTQNTSCCLKRTQRKLLRIGVYAPYKSSHQATHFGECETVGEESGAGKTVALPDARKTDKI